MTDRLSDEEIERRLLLLPRWQRAGLAIECRIRFASFAAAAGFVTAVAVVSESRDHHPDIDLRWRTVILRLSTHDAGGLTAADFALATALEPLLPPDDEPVN